MFTPLGGALPVEVHAPTLSKNPDLSIKNIPTSCGRQDVCWRLEQERHRPRRKPLFTILQHWGLRGVSGGLSTLGQHTRPAQCKTQEGRGSMWGTHNLSPKINPPQKTPIPTSFRIRPAIVSTPQPPRYLILLRLLPSFGRHKGQRISNTKYLEKKDGPR